MATQPSKDYSARLRRVAAQLAELSDLSSQIPAVERARDRLQRDLLPRTAGGDQSVVVGIVGPNNAGKSALFNALTGGEHSPSLPTGGATRRLVGAARPGLAAELSSRPEWNRFTLIPFDGGSASERQRALANAVDPAELLLVTAPSVPPGLLLIDTPDFDSIARENRFASEALLAVADVVIAVVTRHSYQNAEVVDYLRRWLYHGRPWLLVYNEASSPELVRQHADKLAADVGSQPFAVYQAPHSLEVMEGRAPLEPLRLEQDASAGSGARLVDSLANLGEVKELKRAALSASLAQLAGDLREIDTFLRGRSRVAAATLERARDRCRAAAESIASRAMPGGPFLTAFRTVLDRRSNRVSRTWRTGMKGLRLRLEAVPRAILGKGGESDEDKLRGGLHSVELRELTALWAEFYEGLARDLGPEERFAERRDASRELREALDADLSGDGEQALDRAREGLAELPVDFATFQVTCEELVEQAIEQRGFDWDIQAGADLATLLPVAVAAAVMVNTGGFGVDVGVAGSGVVTSLLFERYSALLGTGIAEESQKRWELQRSEVLMELLERSALPTSARLAAEIANQSTGAAAELSDHAATFEQFANSEWLADFEASR